MFIKKKKEVVMDNHLVGKGQNSDGDSPVSTSGETSLSVRQFCAVAFGWLPVHSPSQPWKVLQVLSQEQYCFRCVGMRRHDVVIGKDGWVAFCRCCNEEMK
jgi:hypothetical protein